MPLCKLWLLVWPALALAQHFSENLLYSTSAEHVLVTENCPETITCSQTSTKEWEVPKFARCSWQWTTKRSKCGVLCFEWCHAVHRAVSGAIFRLWHMMFPWHHSEMPWFRDLTQHIQLSNWTTEPLISHSCWLTSLTDHLPSLQTFMTIWPMFTFSLYYTFPNPTASFNVP